MLCGSTRKGGGGMWGGGGGGRGDVMTRLTYKVNFLSEGSVIATDYITLRKESQNTGKT